MVPMESPSTSSNASKDLPKAPLVCASNEAIILDALSQIRVGVNRIVAVLVEAYSGGSDPPPG